MNQKGNIPVFIIIGLLILGLVGGAYYFYTNKPKSQYLNPGEGCGGGLRMLTPLEKEDTRICAPGYFCQEKIIDGGGICSPVVNQIISPTPQVSSSAQSNLDISNWKTYTDKMSRFSFKYPAEFTIKEDIGGGNTVFYTDLKDSDEEFRFEIGPSDYVGLFEHFKTNQNENINDISWIIDSNSSYCDAGNCGTPASSIYVKHNNYYVGISIFKEVKSKDTLRNILSTFKFTN